MKNFIPIVLYLRPSQKVEPGVPKPFEIAIDGNAAYIPPTPPLVITESVNRV
jgi:hypothetical protein